VRFFVRSYTRRGRAPKHSKPAKRISQAAEDAAHGVGREVNHLGKAAENSVGDLAHNVMHKINGSGTPKTNEKRRSVSPSIESKVKNFETEGVEDCQGIPLEKKKSQDSLRVSVIRKKASAEHNKLREMFEDSSQALRSVDHSNTKTTSKTKPNATASPSRLQSADEEVKPAKNDNEDVGVEKTGEVGEENEQDINTGAEQNGNEHGSDGVNEEKANKTEDTQEPSEKDASQTPSSPTRTTQTDSYTAANTQNALSSTSETSLPPPMTDTPDTDALSPTAPSSNTSPPSPSRSPTKNGPSSSSSSIPVLARPSPSPRNPSPTRISKIPKLASRSQSPPKKTAQKQPPQKQSTPSPVKNILSKAKPTKTSVAGDENGVVASGSGAMATSAAGAGDQGNGTGGGGGAREKGI
jgi:hypothetical protein